jgi:hypothetical protein
MGMRLISNLRSVVILGLRVRTLFAWLAGEED